MHTITHNGLLHEDMKEWRNWLHQHPELGLEERKTSDYIAKQLESFGLTIHRGLAETGIVATLHGKREGKGVIGLRADIDALPILEKNTFDHRSKHDGNMHACGHDGHTTMLLGAAKYLSENPDFAGTVHFIFQPAEEGVGGGRIMVEEGLFERFPCDAVYGMHNWPGLPAGQFAVHQTAVMAAVDTIKMTITGKGGHAAMPDQTIDPVLISAQVVTALQSIVSRNLSPFQSAVISITMLKGSDASNVIPHEVKLQGTLRYFEAQTGDFVKSRIIELAEGISRAVGGEAEVNFVPGYPATINVPEHANYCVDAASAVVGVGAVQQSLPPSMGAEDFSYMLQVCPGAYIWIGNGEGLGGCMLHNDYYDFNNDILPLGASYWVELVQQRLNS
ncbi:MAG: N-acetyl-L,L-diaminopimelate deacetylase (EC [uncultured Thiotrichaceae bacterium]|uniref:N-acetyl-L,L-diaminopimelate deacetylase (EC) n=1 Tax=uncultured Thiotrichaceae bacterium TaxID=298394 RepID=A0A6S6TYH7_9GAMM|nr:MAG: N-acetyl-L,L-diaminopimelate deacetylase (EC [uncultured Thiotrichaceae bacterium]